MYAPDIAKDAPAKDAPDTGIPKELVHSILQSTATEFVHIIAHSTAYAAAAGRHAHGCNSRMTTSAQNARMALQK